MDNNDERKINCEIIIMCGLPGAGKSTFINENITDGGENKDIYIIDGDEMKTSKNVDKKLKKVIERGWKKIIVDATNTTVSRRVELVNIAKMYDQKISCIWIRTDVKECIRRSKQRHLEGGKNIPAVAINAANNRFLPPTTQEGFDKILEIG